MMPESEVDWTETSLDIHTPAGVASQLVEHLILSSGFELVFVDTPQPRESLYIPFNPLRITARYALAKNGRRIYVLKSASGSAFSSIMSQATTAAFNALSPNGLFIGYSYNLIFRGMVGPFHDGNQADVFELARGLQAFVNTPIEVAHSFAAWDPYHRCGISSGCPWTTRSSVDEDSIFFRFTENDVRIPRVSWRVGGCECRTYSTLFGSRITSGFFRDNETLTAIEVCNYTNPWLALQPFY